MDAHRCHCHDLDGLPPERHCAIERCRAALMNPPTSGNPVYDHLWASRRGHGCMGLDGRVRDRVLRDDIDEAHRYHRQLHGLDADISASAVDVAPLGDHIAQCETDPIYLEVRLVGGAIVEGIVNDRQWADGRLHLLQVPQAPHASKEWPALSVSAASVCSWRCACGAADGC